MNDEVAESSWVSDKRRIRKANNIDYEEGLLMKPLLRPRESHLQNPSMEQFYQC